MKKIIVYLLLSLFISPGFAQSYYTISGKIIDETTKQPLQGASVFAENTTIGTATDSEGAFRLSLPNGGYSVVITYTGYQTETRRVTNADVGSSIIIEIKKKEKSMDEFVVKATYEVADGLEKYGDFFLENFIGNTSNSKQCTIRNKEALKFYYYRRTKKLKILATEPLEIVNEGLGYTIKYELDSFVHEYDSQVSLYTGYPLFQEMESSSVDQLIKWNAARRVAYNGSILHFMRSLYQKKLKGEGFEIQFILKKGENEVAQKLTDFYKSLNYQRDDSSNTVEILPQIKDVAIIYNKEEAAAAYIQANPEASSKFQLSVLSFVPGETLNIEQNGFYFDQNEITITGYWAWEKVGDMLPYDFKEKSMNVGNTKPPVVKTAPPVKPATTQPTPAESNVDTVITQPKPVVEDIQKNAGIITGINWSMDESRVIEGNNMYFYKAGGQDNTINFDNDAYKFNADNTGQYFYKGQQYAFNWKYLDAEKTRIEMAIQYPTPLIVTLENITVTAAHLKYTRLQKVNGVNMVAIESRKAN